MKTPCIECTGHGFAFETGTFEISDAPGTFEEIINAFNAYGTRLISGDYVRVSDGPCAGDYIVQLSDPPAGVHSSVAVRKPLMILLETGIPDAFAPSPSTLCGER